VLNRSRSREDGEIPSRTRRCKGHFFFAMPLFRFDSRWEGSEADIPARNFPKATLRINFDSRFTVIVLAIWDGEAMLDLRFGNLPCGFLPAFSGNRKSMPGPRRFVLRGILPRESAKGSASCLVSIVSVDL
jgi:hypothetical protein